MRTVNHRKTLLFSLMLILAVAGQIAAQTPSPAPPPFGMEGTTLSAFLQELVTNFVAFKTTFINTVEGTLGGYFAVLAYILAWVIAVYYFIQQFIQGEWDAAQIGRFTGSLIVCLLLLVFCGDVDNDGKRGDIVRTPAKIGYYLAFGEDPAEPTGSYINRLVKTERTKFNTNYQKFIENKLMVKINDKDMPVRYPGMQGIQTVAAVSIGQATAEQEKSVLSQEFWIGLLFQVMNFFRSVIELIDFFLLVIFAFGVLVCSIISPFMVCTFVNRDLRKRFTYPFLWTVLTITVIFPALSQACRYFAYLSANIALGTNGNPIYTFDPQTYTIIANGDPTPMILVAVLTMLISIVLLVMSLILSYSFAQGKLVESMSGLIANTFAGLSTVGIGAMVTSMATKLGAEGEKITIAATENAALTGADLIQRGQIASADKIRQASRIQTEGGYSASMVSAQGERVADEQSLIGQYLTGALGVQTEQVTGKMQAQASTAIQIASLNQKEQEELVRKSWDTYMNARGIKDDGEKERLLQESGLLNLPGDVFDNRLASSGIFGNIAGHFINGKTVESLPGIGGRPQGGSPSSKPYESAIIPNFQAPPGSSFSMDDFIEKGLAPNVPLINSPMNGIISPGMPPMPSSPSSGFSVSPDGTPLFKQGDPRWSGTELGKGLLMGDKGCAVTAMAASLSKISGKPITPQQLDKYLDSHNGYSGNNIDWGVAAGAAGLKAGKAPWSLDTINGQVNNGRPVVAGVDRTGDGKTDHWVAVTGRTSDGQGREIYTANDPATGTQIGFYAQGSQLVGTDGKYRTTGELRTISGGNPNPQGLSSGASAQVSTLSAPGIPKNLPSVLLNPNDKSLSRQASAIPVEREDLVYYHPSQEASFVSTGDKKIDSYILGAARTHGINPNLIKAKDIQESQLKSGAVSPKGAEGVAQLMPGTAKEVGVTNTKDPAQSIYGGAKYLRYQADYMVAKGGVRDGAKLRTLSLAGYNAGAGAVKNAGFAVPNYAETKGYVSKITEAVEQPSAFQTKSSADIKQSLAKMSRPEAEVYGKVYGQLYGESKALERNELNNRGSQSITRQSYSDQRNIAAANLNMQYQIADSKAEMQMRAVNQSLSSGRQAADTRFNTKGQVAGINRQAGYESSQVQYEGAVTQAAYQFEGTKESAKIMKNASLEALYKRNLSNLVQSVGGSAAHQFSEMFERASRGW